MSRFLVGTLTLGFLLSAMGLGEAEESPSPPAAPELGPTQRAAKPAPAAGKAHRTLDEITIEGEIAVPQVLFITARDRHRYQDHLHRTYQKSALEVGSIFMLPAYMGLEPSAPKARSN